jgi:hypothetical protein
LRKSNIVRVSETIFTAVTIDGSTLAHTETVATAHQLNRASQVAYPILHPPPMDPAFVRGTSPIRSQRTRAVLYGRMIDGHNHGQRNRTLSNVAGDMTELSTRGSSQRTNA